MLDQPYYQPAEVAKLLGVSAFTVRRWCEWHKEHLSPEANPESGRPRRLSAKDVEVLRHVAQLRTQGLQTGEINAQLSTITFAVVDTEPAPTLTAPLQATQEGQRATSTALQVVEALSTVLSPLEARINRLEARRFDVQSFAFGVIVGLLFVLVFIGVAWVVAR